MSDSVPLSTLSEFLRQSTDKESFYSFVKSKFQLNESSFSLYKKQFDQFVINHDLRWKKKSKCRINHFESQYAGWLNQSFTLQNPSCQQKTKKDFDYCSARTKRRRIDDVQRSISKDEIEGAYLQILNDENEIDAEIVKSLTKLDLHSKTILLEMIRNGIPEIIRYTPDEALAIMIDLKLTKYQYDLLRSQAKSRSADIYPPYSQLFAAKKECYPPKDCVTVTETGTNIELQSLLNHTVKRVIQTCDRNVVDDVASEKLVATYKWGFDGASGQSLYKQVYRNDIENPIDESIVMISLIPLQIESPTKVLWRNESPSSTRLCRPIRFDFAKETKAHSVNIHQFVSEQINRLHHSDIVADTNKTLSVSHKLHSSMFDGKAITHLTDGSTESCNICFALPTEMNDLEGLKKKICIEENYRFGISPLHSWIRFFECILHIAYKMPIGRRSAYSDEHKNAVRDRKLEIQKKFKDEKGLIIDKVKQGAGNSNDGNTARRFFEDCKFAAQTTRVNENLIRRFRCILVAINSSRRIDIPKFKTYAYETAKLYIKQYSWYYMPPSVHKVLLHGGDVMETFDLPIGSFSEEAQEARNKDFRNAREFNSRKSSRTNTNEDILHWLLISSDPVISSLRTFAPKKIVEFDREQAARQQLERLPRRHTVVNPSTVPVSHSQAGIASSVLNGREISISSAPLQMAAASQQSIQNQANQSQFLLSRFMTPSLQDTEQILLENNRADRSQFVQHLLLSTLSNLQIVHESENDSTPTNEEPGIVDPPQASNATDGNTITQSSELPQQQSQSERVNTKKPAVTQKPVPERRSRPPDSQAQVKGRELKASSMSSKELPDTR